MALIDYGVVVYKNGVCINENIFFQDMHCAVGWDDRKTENHLSGNYFAFVGDKHLAAAFYKYFCRIKLDGEDVFELFGTRHEGEDHKSLHFDVDCVHFHVKSFDGRIIWMRFSYRGDHYNVIYGYGIDPDFDVWNKTKVIYLGKKLSRKVDRIYGRFNKSF